MEMLKAARLVAACALSVCLSAAAYAQVTTGSVSGVVQDAQGGVIPGATAVLIDDDRGTKSVPVVSGAAGEFTFVNIAPGTYTVEVTLTGFRTFRRGGIAVSPGDRIAIGTVAMQIGGTSEVVDVTAVVPFVQSQSGERSFTIDTNAVQNLPMANRSFATLASLTPGVEGTSRIGGSGQTNFMMDGISTMDTGSNRLLFALNVESIAEVKVLTSGYQAEYGRASGLQVTAVTKSGGNRFHGSVYTVERNSDWNANSRTNILNGDPKTLTQQRDTGFSIGGPVGKPGGSNKIFFFYSQEFEPRKQGNLITRHRMPTALERQGDFSQSTDNNGNPFPFVRDPRLSGNCNATSQAACFADGGVLGRIPQSRLYGLGLNILRQYPMPNIADVPAGQAYNYELIRDDESVLSHQPAIKVDYQPTAALRLSFKYSAFDQREQVIPGTIPGWNDTRMIQPIAMSTAGTFNYTLSPTTFLEATVGLSGARQHGCFQFGANGSPLFCRNAFPMNDVANRNNVGLGGLPFPFPEASALDPRYYITEIFDRSGSPAWDGTQAFLQPDYAWGNRIGNSPPNRSFPSVNRNATKDVNVTITKVTGRHTFKAGFYNSYSDKEEGGGIGDPALSFANDTNNPNDSGFGFANAALGIFTTYSQRSKDNEVHYVYSNTEGFVQDNWKITPRFTLDYGLRVVRQQPAYDSRLSGANFFLDRWSASEVPLMYIAGCANGVYPCSGANRQAMHPVTGQFLGASSTPAIGTLVPGTGNAMNGLVRPGDGIVKTFHTNPLLAPAPRVGFAWALRGDQSLVVRGGGGIFFNRPSAGSCGPCNNPPTSETVTMRFSQLDSLGTTGLTLRSAPGLSVIQYEQRLPSSAQWNAGVQLTLPFNSMLDVAYTGERGYNNRQTVNINSIDLGTAFLDQSQDRTLSSTTPGANAFGTELLRPYRGFNAINQVQDDGWSNFHSLQLSWQRRFSGGLSFGFNDTIALQQDSSVARRLQHNADGTYSVRADQARAQELLGNANPVVHRFKGNFVWDLPDLRGGGGVVRAIGMLANDWQLSGIWTASTSSPYAVGFSYQNGGSSINLTGSPDFAPRIRIAPNADLGGGCSSNVHRQFNPAAFLGPLVGSDGLESGTNYLRGCFQSVFDASIARNVRLGGGRALQIRVDLFNAFNEARITGRNTTINYSSPADPVTINNLPFDPDGNLIAARSIPRGAGVGVATGYQAPRSVQAQVRFTF